jgi:hypothetical protein
MTNLSDTARKALISAPARQGGKVLLPEGPLLRELKDAGYVGQSGGLTVKGTIARERAVRQAEDLAFGA